MILKTFLLSSLKFRSRNGLKIVRVYAITTTKATTTTTTTTTKATTKTTTTTTTTTRATHII